MIKATWICFCLWVLSVLLCSSETLAFHYDGEKISAKILALFSGTTNDLGLDHRLGRQVLKLAVEKAKSLHPNELRDIQLIVQNDDTDCNNLNSIPNWVAEQFYQDYSSKESTDCRLLESAAQHLQSNCSTSDLETRNLDSVLLQRNQDATINQTQARRRRFAISSGEDVVGDSIQTGSWSQGQVDAIIGPSCDYLVDLVARMAAYWRKPIYSMTSVSAMFSRKDIYTTMTRLSPSIDHLSMFLMKILERFKWRHLAMILDKNRVENSILYENLEKIINRQRYLIPIERKLFSFKSISDPSKSDTTNNSSASSTPSLCSPEIRKILLGARRVARVFMLLLNDHQSVRKLLLCGYELGMSNGEYSFLAFNLGLRSSQLNAATSQDATQSAKARASVTGNANTATDGANSIQQNFDWYSAEDEANNLIARQMFESLMVFSVELPISEEYNLFVEQALDMTLQEYPGVRFDRTSIGPVAIALHDSLLLAIEALVRFNRNNPKQNHSAYSGEDTSSLSAQEAPELSLEETRRLAREDLKRVPLMWNERYPNGLISSLHINSNGDQELDYVLSDLEPEMGLLRPVASYSKEKREIKFMPNSYIHWPMRMNAAKSQAIDNDEPPADEPECGFTGEAERCVDRQNLYAALMVVAVLAVIIAIVASLSLRQYFRVKYQMQLDDYWWRINWVDLQFIQAAGSLGSNPQSVVRAIKSGGSVISAASGSCHEATSLIVTSPHEAVLARQRARRAAATARNEASGEHQNQSTISLGNRQRKQAAVSVVVTSEKDTGQQQQKALEPARVSAGRGALSMQPSDADGQTRVSSLIDHSCIIKSEYSIATRASKLAMYKSELVIVKQLNATTIEVTRELLIEMKSIRELVSDNLAKFVGLCIEPGRLSIIYEYCSRGSLQDLLLNESVSMDVTLMHSIIGDLLNGLNFIHTTSLDYHGRLKSTNLVLDSRFTVKITDFGTRNLYSQLDLIESHAEDEYEQDIEDDSHSVATTTNQQQQQQQPTRPTADGRKLSVSQMTCNMDSVSVRAENIHGHSALSGGSRAINYKNRGAMRYYWTAPEHLRSKNPLSCGSKKGDIYALGVILSEILTRKLPYHYGTNAKPYWPEIKRNRKSHQSMAHGPEFKGRSNRLDSHVSDGSGAISSLLGRQTRKVQGKLKRNTATVKPSKLSSGHDNISSVGEGTEMGEAESVVSGGSSHQSGIGQLVAMSSGQLANSEAVAHTNRGAKRGSIKTIDGKTNEEADEGLDHLGVAGPTASSSKQHKDERLDPEDILDHLRMGIEPEPVRPYVPNYVLVDGNVKLFELMRLCWAEAPQVRPTIGQVRNQMRRLTQGAAAKNYLDNLLERLQKYAANLERIVDSKTSDIVEEKRRTEELLYQLVPKFVAEKLKRNEPIIPQVFDGVTIFFSDIVGFEKYASVMSPCDLVDLLNNIYSSFESIISSFDVTKIEVILDQYLVAAGISFDQPQTFEAKQQEQESSGDDAKDAKKNGKSKRKLLEAIRLGTSEDNKSRSNQNEAESADQAQAVAAASDRSAGAIMDSSPYMRSSAEQIARMALCVRDLMKSFHFRQNLGASKKSEATGDRSKGEEEEENEERKKNVGAKFTATFNIRIGIHSGKVCAGIVGVKRPKYCLIGDTVNVASRMHTNSKANRIQISANTRELLKAVPGFSLEPRGRIEVKGKGAMDTYWLESSY